MKSLIVFILLLTSNIAISQEINQFDANGKRHGIWRKNYDKTNVVRYEGEFFHGKEVGLFKFYKKIDNKAVLTATKQFNKDNNIAQVKFLTSTGKVISEGKMKGKAYIETWIYYYVKTNQILSKDQFNNQGLLHDERIVNYENGKLAQKEHYNNGKLHGKITWYSETGIVLKEYNYENGELHGLAKFFNKLGTLVIEGQYKSDKKHGVWKYYESGKLVKEKDFTRRSKNPYKK